MNADRNAEIKAVWDRAIALFEQGRFGESLDRLLTLEASLPDNPQLLSNLGVVYRDSGDLARAEQYFRRVCALRPDHPAAHFNLAVTLLCAGRLRQGFQEYEWRWQVEQFAPQRRQFSQPGWRGRSASAYPNIDGHRILLYGEQGAGDAIQFVRYAPLVRDRGGDVILEVLPHLERLMSWLDGGYPVVNALSAGVEFDMQCPLMSLPLQFGTELDSIPPSARFSIPADLKSKWAARLRTEQMGVGVVWAANPNSHNSASRSIPARYFLPLTRQLRIRCWSLQVGPAAADIPDGMVDLSEELIDFGETAAVISALDLVITIDTAVAHLAGSLGKPVWLLLPYTPDWRWMLEREDTPWYPTMRLFRQERPGEWGDLVERVISELGLFPPNDK